MSINNISDHTLEFDRNAPESENTMHIREIRKSEPESDQYRV